MNNLIYCKNEIKHRLSCKDVLVSYGLSVNRSGFVSCPFHNERTPSMKVNDKGYKCFGCGKGGDVIDFVQSFFQLSFKDAIHKLNDDFNLCLPLETKIDRTAMRKAVVAEMRRKAEKIKNERIKESLTEQYFNLVSAENALKAIIKATKPKKTTDVITNEYVYAVTHLPHIQYEISILEVEIRDRNGNTKLY